MPVTNGPSGTKPFATCPENADESAARIGACRKAFSEAAKKEYFRPLMIIRPQYARVYNEKNVTL